jgi:CRP-like cAMP-binding protein
MAKVTRADMQRLLDQRDQLLREIDALRHKVSGIEMAIALLDNTGDAKGTPRSTRSVKTVVLDLLQELGTTGLNATTAVEMANRRGISLNAASVSSTLSRFKRDGIVSLHGDKYRLSEFDAPKESTIRPLWGQPAA